MRNVLSRGAYEFQDMSQPTAVFSPILSGRYSAVKKINSQCNVADRAQFLGYTHIPLNSNFVIILSYLIICYVTPVNDNSASLFVKPRKYVYDCERGHVHQCNNVRAIVSIAQQGLYILQFFKISYTH